MAVLRLWKVADVISSGQSPSQTGHGASNQYYFAHPDNESHATTCWNAASSTPNAMFGSDLFSHKHCQCTPNLFHRVLYWCKMILIKVARSYYALPVLLLLATLLLGVFIGYCIGQQQRFYNIRRSQNSQQPRLETSTRLHSDRYFYAYSIVGLLHSFIIWFSEMMQSQRMFFINNKNRLDIEVKEEMARIQLLSENESQCESGILPSELPRHIAVVMDGNRRYGLEKYNNAIQGHWDGSQKLLQFTKWCIAERISEITVYAFSTENWSRDGAEITSLMNIILKHCAELRIEAVKKRISIRIHSTDPKAIPFHVREALYQLQKDTLVDQPALLMNICLSYGGRGEIVNACRSIVEEYATGRRTCTSQINEETLSHHMLISGPPPDILIRTSGEVRLSNFLLWQMAYTELFFLSKNWPELEKDDFLNVIRSYARGRTRRYGK